MPAVAPLPREDLAEFELWFKAVEGVMGFVPNSLFTNAAPPGHPPRLRGACARSAVITGGTF
ncbi:MAG: hypothetical protein ACR2HN_01680 [Tepidiformaceae bacterium]